MHFLKLRVTLTGHHMAVHFLLPFFNRAWANAPRIPVEPKSLLYQSILEVAKATEPSTARQHLSMSSRNTTDMSREGSALHRWDQNPNLSLTRRALSEHSPNSERRPAPAVLLFFCPSTTLQNCNCSDSSLLTQSWEIAPSHRPGQPNEGDRKCSVL